MEGLGNAAKGTPGTAFVIDGVNFTVLDKRIAVCECGTEMRRDKAKDTSDLVCYILEV